MSRWSAIAAAAVMWAAATGWGTSWVQWLPQFELWMPTVYSREDGRMPEATSNEEMPFETPKLLLAPPIAYQALEIEPLAVMISRQEYFGQPAATEGATAEPKVILEANGKIYKLPASGLPWPKEWIVFREVSGLAIAATWEENTTEAQKSKMKAAWETLTEGWPPGVYPGTSQVE